MQHLVVPPLVLSLLPTGRTTLLETEIEQLAATATRMYGVIMHKLAWNLHIGTKDNSNTEELEQWIASLAQYHKQETQLFFSMLEEVRMEARASVLDVNRLKRKLCVNAVTWNASLAELEFKVSGNKPGRDKSPNRIQSGVTNSSCRR